MSQKKRLFAVAALSMASAAAMAQTSVSLYGIVDAAVRSETAVNRGQNGGSIKTLAPGGMSQSRLGINISEDMGGGSVSGPVLGSGPLWPQPPERLPGALGLVSRPAWGPGAG